MDRPHWRSWFEPWPWEADWTDRPDIAPGDRSVDGDVGVASVTYLGLQGDSEFDVPTEIVTASESTTTHVAGLRLAERDTIVALVAAGHRLLTLTGLGGVGKSALAVDVLDAVVEASPQTIVSALTVEPTEAANIRTRLNDELGVVVDHLAARGPSTLPSDKRFAVIDGGEHLLEHVNDLEEILSAVPGLQLLVTSRVPLRLPSEVTVPVRGLDTGPDGDGVTLFMELAKERVVRIAAESRPRVRDIVARLGGYPLAIRLCVARLPQLSLSALHEAMVASSGDPDRTTDATETLRHVIGFSLERESSNVLNLLRQLSVFGGWYTLDSIEGIAAIVEQPTGGPHRRSVGRTLWLSELVSAGLVDTEPAPLLGDDARLYRVHDSIREVVRGYEFPEALPQEILTAAHHEWYSTRAVELAGDAATRREREAFSQLQTENAAYTSALDSMIPVDPPDVLRIVNQTGEFWVTRGRMRTGARLLRRALQHLGEDSDGWGHGSLTTVLAQSWLAHMKLRERAPLAVKQYQQWLVTHLRPIVEGGATGSHEHFTLAVHFVYVSLVTRAYPAALRVAARCRDLAVAAGDDYHAGLFCFYLARLSEQADDLDEAVKHIRRAIEHVQRTQNDSFLARCVSQEVLLRQSSLTPAELVKELTPLPAIHLRHRSFKDAALITIPLILAHFQTGEQARAIVLLRQTLALSRRIHFFDGQLYAVVLIAFAELSASSTPENVARCARLYGGFRPHLKRFQAITAPHYQEMLESGIQGLRMMLGPAPLEHLAGQAPASWLQVMNEADAFASTLLETLTPDTAETAVDPVAALDAALASLNEREKSLLDLLLTGLMDKQIADRMKLKPNTVRSYNSRIFRKLGVASRTELLALFRGREV